MRERQDSVAVLATYLSFEVKEFDVIGYILPNQFDLRSYVSNQRKLSMYHIAEDLAEDTPSCK